MVKIKKIYDEIVPVEFKSDLPSETKQSMRDECDLNLLIQKYPNMLDNGIAALQSGQFAGFEDFTMAPTDLQEAMDAVDEVQARFAELPAAVRDKFGSDPLSLLSFLSNPANDEEAVKLGLKIKPENLAVETGKELPATPIAEEVK